MIRRADISDIPSIRAMAGVVFPHTYRTILSPSQLDYMMEMMYSEDSLFSQMTVLGHTFYLDEGRGYVSYRHDGRSEDGVDVYHLEKLYVMPSGQHSGIGRALFEKVLGEIRSIGDHPCRIELNVNRQNPAVSFYEHLGMHKARQGDFPIGEGFYMNDFIMSMNI